MDLQTEIQEFIYKDNQCFCRFEYEKNLLKLYTTNPRHNETFLLTSIEGKSKEECLKKCFMKIKKKTTSKQSLTYMVEWFRKGDPKTTLSYFTVSGLKELTNHFFEGEEKNEHDYFIYNIKLRPLT